MKFLITGANGQLAREFQKRLTSSNHKITALTKNNLDISNFNAVLETISTHSPDIVLNCAAYNLVDKAEEDFETAFRVNALGAKNLAIASKKHNALLIHYSTDYVFDGTKEDFYSEDDKPNPINNYGRSKLKGEYFLKEETDNFLLFRVSWVFGEGKQNFLFKLLEWSKKNNILKIVCDQVSVPTYTEDIVSLTLRALDDGLTGLYNLTNSGYASRYEVARYFFEKAGLERIILPVESGYFPSSAMRPYFSALSNAKLKKDLRLDIPAWKNGIDRFVKSIGRFE